MEAGVEVGALGVGERAVACSGWDASATRARSALIASVSPSANIQCVTWPAGFVSSSLGAPANAAARLPSSARST